MYSYKTKGTCSTQIDIDVREGKIHSVSFQRGCTGSLSAIGKLVEGLTVEEAIARTEGIQCQNGTSCPDQLSKALRQILEQQR